MQKSISLVCGTLLLVACGGSGENVDTPEQAQSVFADASTTAFTDKLVTGTNSADNQTRWICDISNVNQTSSNYILSFWSDQTGIAGSESMSWYPLDDEQVDLSWGANKVTLNNFIFSDESDVASFSATSNKNDRLDCLLSGPRPVPGSLLQDFAPITDIRLVNERSDQNDNWVCLATDINGAADERHYTFWLDGMGSSDKGNFSWYYNDDENIIVSYANEVRELRSIRYNSDSEPATAFTALDRQYTLNCSRS